MHMPIVLNILFGMGMFSLSQHMLVYPIYYSLVVDLFGLVLGLLMSDPSYHIQGVGNSGDCVNCDL